MSDEIKVTGLDKVVVQLRRVHHTVMRRVKATMQEAAGNMKEMAKDFAPVDKYRLEESIDVRPGRDERRYTQWTMTMGGVIDGVDVDQYATLMHENYEDIISPEPVDEYGRVRREGSIEKDKRVRAKYRGDPRAFVGGKFLERAADITRERIDKRVLDVVTEVTRQQ